MQQLYMQQGMELIFFLYKSNLGELTGALYHCYQSILPLCFVLKK